MKPLGDGTLTFERFCLWVRLEPIAQIFLSVKDPELLSLLEEDLLRLHIQLIPDHTELLGDLAACKAGILLHYILSV